MTREQLAAIFTDNGLEVPNKGVLSQFLNAFNQEKITDILNAKTKAFDEAEAKYKGFVSPEDHQKIVDELNTEKGKGALAERKAKYQKANLNIEDEDVLSLVESKLKDSKKFDEDLADYVKAHPSFLKVAEPPKEKGKPAPQQKVVIGGAGSDKGEPSADFSMQDAVKEYYSQDKK